MRGTPGAAAAALPAAVSFESEVRPIFEKHCVECHDAETKKGDFDLTALKSDLTQPQVFAQWVKVYDQIASGEMPPVKKPRLDTAAAAGYRRLLPAAAAAVAGGTAAGVWHAMACRTPSADRRGSLIARSPPGN